MRDFGSSVRFLLAGGLNTTLTYLLYLALLKTATHQVSYAISFACGIAISYVLGRLFVFKVHRGYRSALMLPFVYLIQYLAGAAVVWIWVDYFKQHAMFAPAIAILITLPVTYILSKYAFVGNIR